MKARVWFAVNTDVSVTVEIPAAIEDEEGRREAAIEAAYGLLPRGLCAHCSGWHQAWTRDENDNPELASADPVEFLDGDS